MFLLLPYEVEVDTQLRSDDDRTGPHAVDSRFDAPPMRVAHPSSKIESRERLDRTVRREIESKEDTVLNSELEWTERVETCE